MPGVTYSGIGPPLGCDTVLCDELGQGLFVLQNSHGIGLVFSTSLTDVEKTKTWLQKNQQGAPPPLSTELYNYSNGTRTDPAQIKSYPNYKGPASLGSVLTCTEHNSDWSGPGQNACCVRGLGPFNRAFHPNPRAFPKINVDGLMAVEYEKNLINQLFDDQNTRTLNKWNSVRGTNFTTYQQLLNYLYSPAFNQDWASVHELFNVGSSSINTDPPILSGLRLYPKNLNPYAYANIPWGTVGVYTSGIDQWGQVDCCSKTGYVDPHRIGKVTSASSPGLLINQITASTSSPYYYEVRGRIEYGYDKQGLLVTTMPENSPSKVIYNYYRQRCQVMQGPSPYTGFTEHQKHAQWVLDSQADIDSVWQNTKLEVGDTWYVYVDPVSRKLTANKTLPAAFGSTSGLPALPKPPKVVTLFNKYTYKYVTTSDRSSQRVIKSAEFIGFDGWPGGLGGTTCLYAHPYEPLSGIINSQFDFNIHNRTFLAYGDDAYIKGHNYAQDNVILEQATGGVGAKGCVGRISFSQNAYNIGGPVPFVAPD